MAPLANRVIIRSNFKTSFVLLLISSLHTGAAILKANIDDTRQMVSDMKLSKPIQIGTSDAGSFFNKQILESVDYGVCIYFSQ